MIADYKRFYYETYLDCYFLGDNKEIILYKHFNKGLLESFHCIMKATLDESNSLKDKIIVYKTSNEINDFVPISDDKIFIVECYFFEIPKQYIHFLLIKSLKTDNSYKIPTIFNYDKNVNLKVKFFKEKNILIIIDHFSKKAIYFFKFNEAMKNYQFFLKLSIDNLFKINVLNKKAFIIAINDCLLFYVVNSFKIKKKLYYDDEEEIDDNNINEENEDEDEDEYEYEYEYIDTEGNYKNELSESNDISSCLSNDKKYLAVSNLEGRLYIYNTKNFKKEKIKKFRNFIFSFLPSYIYNQNELEKINTIKIHNIKPISNFFVLSIEYAFSKENQNIEYKNGLIPLKKFGKIWQFEYILDNLF